MAPSLMEMVSASAKSLIQPHLVAIYDGEESRPIQVGTGFLVEWECRAVLVTAKHVLYGHKFDEDPRKKSFFHDGCFVRIDSRDRNIVKANDHDVAALAVDECSASDALPLKSVSYASPRVGRPITFMGYLARDFRRGGQALRPKPFLYTDRSVPAGSGLIGIAYAKNRARSTNSGLRVMTPTPRGISGGPMVDTASLLLGRVEVRGVFTDHLAHKGMAYGEDVKKVIALLGKI